MGAGRKSLELIRFSCPSHTSWTLQLISPVLPGAHRGHWAAVVQRAKTFRLEIWALTLSLFSPLCLHVERAGNNYFSISKDYYEVQWEKKKEVKRNLWTLECYTLFFTLANTCFVKKVLTAFALTCLRDSVSCKPPVWAAVHGQCPVTLSLEWIIERARAVPTPCPPLCRRARKPSTLQSLKNYTSPTSTHTTNQ